MKNMSATAIDLDDLDLFVSGDPHAAWARLRREAPLHWNAGPDGTGHGALTRYADVETIRAGDTVTLWNAPANRDPDAFAEPDRLDLGRTPDQHLAFGVAHHRCVGMGAARREIALLTEEIVRRGLRCEIPGPVRRPRSNFMPGITHLPVTVTDVW
ncbi:hypothetical protein AQJ43_29045 [Streptomyces avermitilis]|uniref:Cytochrome P450 n=2 Tax=Streptomyces avermitilis TaxID=33903 RepID=Q82PN3_STRAW|nr:MULTISPECIES: cytochrome P450 [Streptomyces]KUN51285.1 hypothetical protein AQJ43_29045 [Streptomyces avermitilis]MYS96509.1 hypothetical protein [Streptomyces sp. SID5469]BAC68576.1 hypothetical protein SAVERM_866 [Streptomyces avermitilis MA-4680 = NBRC 14893]